MIKTLLFDFSRVLLFPKDQKYSYGLNRLYNQLSEKGKFSFYDYFELNQELLEYLNNIKDKIALCIFTSETIQDSADIAPKLKPIFKNIYSANSLGLSKKDPQSYLFIAHDLMKKPEEILFIDDTLDNIQAAQQAGLQTILYQSNSQLFKELQDLLSSL